MYISHCRPCVVSLSPLLGLITSSLLPSRQRSRPTTTANRSYRSGTIVVSRCLRPSLSCKRPLRTPARGPQSRSSPSFQSHKPIDDQFPQQIFTLRSREDIESFESKETPSPESLHPKSNFLTLARFTLAGSSVIIHLSNILSCSSLIRLVTFDLLCSFLAQSPIIHIATNFPSATDKRKTIDINSPKPF